MQIGRLFACMVLKAEALEAKISARMEKKSRGVSFYYSAFFFFFISFFLKRISLLFEI